MDTPPILCGCANCHQQNAKENQRGDDNENCVHHAVGNHHAYQNVQEHKKRDTAQNGLWVFHASFKNQAPQLMVGPD